MTKADDLRQRADESTAGEAAADATSEAAARLLELKADRSLRQALAMATADALVTALFVVDDRGVAREGVARADFDSKEEWRGALRQTNQHALARRKSGVERSLSRAGVQVTSGGTGRLLRVRGTARALRSALELEGVCRAMLDRKL